MTQSARQWPRRRSSLFQKYFIALFTAVVLSLLANGASEAWFGYRDQAALLDRMLAIEARSAASRIQSFLDDIKDQLGWMVQLPWEDDADESHRIDALRLLRQVPAITELILVDGRGIERLHVSRIAPDVAASNIDRSSEPAVQGARSARIWYGPVTLHRASEPFITIAAAGTRTSSGVVIAEINLKLIWDVIAAIKIGRTGEAFVVDRPGHLVAHPDLNLVLRGNDEREVRALTAMLASTRAGGGKTIQTIDPENRTVLAATAPVAGPDWTVFVVEPTSEIMAPVWVALWRTLWLLLAGACVAAALAYVLAHRMAEPIHQLEVGAMKIGAGQFDHRIDISSGDELERLADRFNEMAGELAISQERSERIGRLKRFLAPQVAELVERAGEEALLNSSRTDIVVIFCDLRGFTGFATRAGPEEVMGLLREYYEALGAIITRYRATLTNMAGDGLMMLLNAPVPMQDATLVGARMTIEMQIAAQGLVRGWRARGYRIGFGIGLAKGVATVGRIGYEGRLDYTAIGSVVNLASRLCTAADNGQILVDESAASEIATAMRVTKLGSQLLRGFDENIVVYSIAWDELGTDIRDHRKVGL
ncbi:MAG: HAMP domain-containing protein [Hyphomicrobiales bacterium]|nr:HAMP domain-containing protein [Hyphomicrobiales bacterium]